MASWLGWLKKKPQVGGAQPSAPGNVLDQHALDLERGRYERIVALLAQHGAAAPEVGEPRTIDELRAARVRLAAASSRAAGLEALSEAERLAAEIADPRERAVLLMGICSVHARTGDASALPGLLDAVAALFEANDLDPSLLVTYLAATSAVDRPDVEHSTAAEVTRRVAAIVEACPDPERRIAAVTEFSATHALTGDFDGAREWLARIEDDYWSWHARATLVDAQCRAGEIAGALESAEPIRDVQIRDRVNKSLAGAWARAGESERANATVALIRDEELRGDAALDVALGRASRGDGSGAREWIDSLDDQARRWSALAHMALAHMERGDVESAAATAGEIEDIDWRERTHSEFVGLLLARGEIENAQSMAESIGNPSLRMRALRRIADRLAPEQHEDKARLLDEALKAATHNRTRPADESDASFMAAIFVDLGRTDLACEVFTAMATTERRDEILYTIARAVAATGDAAAVESLLVRFDEPLDRARILIAAASGAFRHIRRTQAGPERPG